MLLYGYRYGTFVVDRNRRNVGSVISDQDTEVSIPTGELKINFTVHNLCIRVLLHVALQQGPLPRETN